MALRAGWAPYQVWMSPAKGAMMPGRFLTPLFPRAPGPPGAGSGPFPRRSGGRKGFPPRRGTGCAPSWPRRFFHDSHLLFRDRRIMRKPPRPWRPFLQSGVRLGKAVQIDFERVHFCNHGDHPERPVSQAGPGTERVHFCNHRSGSPPSPVPKALKKPVSPGFLRMSGPVVLPVAGMIRRPCLPSLLLVRPVDGIGFHLPRCQAVLRALWQTFAPQNRCPLFLFPGVNRMPQWQQGILRTASIVTPPFMERRSSAKRKTRKEVPPRRLNGKRIPDIPEETMKNCVRNFSERMNRKELTTPPEEGAPESVFHRRHFWQNFSAANTPSTLTPVRGTSVLSFV